MLAILGDEGCKTIAYLISADDNYFLISKEIFSSTFLLTFYYFWSLSIEISAIEAKSVN